MSFNTSAQITSALVNVLKLADPTTLSSAYTSTIIPASLSAAFQEIVTRLAQRGFTLAQIMAWDRGQEFELDISLYWCLVKGAALQDVDATFINKLDRRAELEGVVVTSGGIVVPATTIIGFGTMDQTYSGFKRSVDKNGIVSRIPW